MFAGRAALADDPTTPPTTPPATKPPVVITPGDRDMLRDLKGAPPEVKKLIVGFDVVADKYRAEQRALLKKLKDATPEQREAIRKELQANREAFLAELKSFREDLRKDLADLKGKISHAEFERILDAAKDAAKPDHSRKGTQ